MKPIPTSPPSRYSRRLGARACLPLALFFGLAGCGGGFKPYSGAVYPVKGQVLLANGKPLTGGRIIFLPQKLGMLAATGDIASDGNFTLKSADARDGAAPGEYKVRIEPSESMLPRDKKGRYLKPLPFPASYSDEDGDTGLTATVKTEANQLEPFKLDAVKVK